MRLWHEKLISKLPRQQLLGQHRECCALRGNGWGKPHAIVNYVFRYAPIRLVRYHQLIMDEMKQRGYNVNELWLDPYYRGKSCESFDDKGLYGQDNEEGLIIYPEHNEGYLTECIDNLSSKGIYISF
ncbi:TIGR02328 family protein [Aquibacillus kalidii]|uniref:TIGR02328 family protein n=1 Tax=Aquibacillus kalidii TaxID=2762597 RepID=UPI001646253C|nr:TIGR02328 family protein [Aquibacillus kalidii]